MSVQAAKRMFAEAGLALHGHHSHGHAPYASHDPPHAHGDGWYPPGAGPFRPGPGAPTFGARMPDTHKPGVSFGPNGQSYYRNSLPIASMGASSYLVGSSQRWYGNTHVGGPAPIAAPATVLENKPVRLTSAQVAELRAMMLAALGSTTKAAQHHVTFADLVAAGRRTPGKSQAITARASDFRNALTWALMTPAQQQAFLDAQNQAVANAAASLGGFGRPTYADPLASWGTPQSSSPSDGGSSLSLNINPPSVNVQPPSVNASSSINF